MTRIGMVGMFVLALAGCGGQAPPPVTVTVTAPATVEVATGEATESAPETVPGGQPDPCSFVAKAEAEQVTRTPLQDAVAAGASCVYTGPVDGPVAQFEIGVGPGAKKQLDIERALGHTLTPVPDVGDETLLMETDFSYVFIRKGDLWVSLHLVLLNEPAQNRERMLAAARIAADRM